MPLLVLACIPVVILAIIALTPLILVQRYRTGTARRRARAWVATLNVAGLVLSSIFFLAGAAVTTFWVPDTVFYALAGFAAGCALGVVGLLMTRWESAGGALHYTPNRVLVLAITLAVASRVAWGFWRGWRAWHTAPDGSWTSAAGAAGSLGAGAIVLGYYLTYAIGVRRKLRSVRPGAT